MPSGGAVGAGTAPIPLPAQNRWGLTRSILPTTPMPGPISGTRVCDTPYRRGRWNGDRGILGR